MRIFLCLLLLGLPLHSLADWLSDSRDMMGTRVAVELWAESEALGRATIENAMAAMQHVDWMMNPLNADSALYRVNQGAFTAPVTVPPALYGVIERALHFSRLSDGAFDISFASVGQFYDYRAGRAPPADVVASNRELINYRAIVLDASRQTVAFSSEGLKIDLGGIAKGYAVDQAINILVDAGYTAGIVSAGGDSRILGDHRDRPRMIGIKHPRKKEEFAVMIPLSDTAISTSGDYERFFIKDGIRVHHILDPKTGHSSATVQSVSVLAAKAIDSDALSTTTFVLGVEKGLALIDSLPDVEAIIIDAAGKLHYSAGLLRQATLRQADLRQASLRQASLRQADLRQADLRQADLRQADLRQGRLPPLQG
jgi:thiamine biosynthesis lipoprotein